MSWLVFFFFYCLIDVQCKLFFVAFSEYIAYVSNSWKCCMCFDSPVIDAKKANWFHCTMYLLSLVPKKYNDQCATHLAQGKWSLPGTWLLDGQMTKSGIISGHNVCSHKISLFKRIEEIFQQFLYTYRNSWWYGWPTYWLIISNMKEFSSSDTICVV